MEMDKMKNDDRNKKKTNWRCIQKSFKGQAKSNISCETDEITGTYYYVYPKSTEMCNFSLF